MKKKPDLKALGVSASANKGLYQFSKPNATLLERFPSPLRQQSNPGNGSWIAGLINIEAPEVTSLCPITGQPDFATIKIEYTPQEWCVESKSLKLYLNGFRNHGMFHEKMTQRIADDLIRLLEPQFMRVTGEFAPRGGIRFWPSVTYHSNTSKEFLPK